MGGYVMQLQNFSVNDGEGIRTNVFLAGCPLRCAWCANPEGQTLVNEMTVYMTAEEVIGQIKKQMLFYRYSGGGVTFSGGEPTMQAFFLRELVQELYDMGISLAIETCGAFAFDRLSDILKKMDLIFLDIKQMDEAKHIEFTGATNRNILDNLPKIASLSIPLVVRIPVIHGVNAEKLQMKRIFAFIKSSAPEASVELLPYHTLGEGKYETLGMHLPPAGFTRPSDAELKGFAQLAAEMGVKTVTYQ